MSITKYLRDKALKKKLAKQGITTYDNGNGSSSTTKSKTDKSKVYAARKAKAKEYYSKLKKKAAPAIKRAYEQTQKEKKTSSSPGWGLTNGMGGNGGTAWGLASQQRATPRTKKKKRSKKQSTSGMMGSGASTGWGTSAMGGVGRGYATPSKTRTKKRTTKKKTKKRKTTKKKGSTRTITISYS